MAMFQLHMTSFLEAPPTQFWTMLGQTDQEGLVEKLTIGGAPSVPPFVLKKILKIVDTKY